jgi:hypothetical protein
MPTTETAPPEEIEDGTTPSRNEPPGNRISRAAEGLRGDPERRLAAKRPQAREVHHHRRKRWFDYRDNLPDA